ncbi:hypothetical protein LZC95_24115 [Pendulispora brunnea]|uniref:Uncharacterized protein n=1 Tax=Pendulispora brunnea TaxID=2905690 RepID=A0ABZ2KMI8_9BACT
MKALISELVAKADLSQEQAEKVANVVRNFIGSKVPDAVRGHVESALTGEKVEGVIDAAKNAVSNFLK